MRSTPCAAAIWPFVLLRQHCHRIVPTSFYVRLRVYYAMPVLLPITPPGRSTKRLLQRPSVLYKHIAWHHLKGCNLSPRVYANNCATRCASWTNDETTCPHTLVCCCTPGQLEFCPGKLSP